MVLIKTLSIMTLGVMAPITPFRIMALSIMTLRKMTHRMTHRKTILNTQDNNAHKDTQNHGIQAYDANKDTQNNDT